MSKTISELQLAPLMDVRARELLHRFPMVVYSSGRRTLHEQAHAMAVNHIQDSGYLMRTYFHAAELLRAINLYSLPHSIDSVTDAIYWTLMDDSTLVKGPHLTGDAVDIVPMESVDGTPTPAGQEVIEWIKSCPDTTDFRTRENQLRRWHWACVPPVEI